SGRCSLMGLIVVPRFQRGVVLLAPAPPPCDKLSARREIHMDSHAPAPIVRLLSRTAVPLLGECPALERQVAVAGTLRGDGLRFTQDSGRVHFEARQRFVLQVPLLAVIARSLRAGGLWPAARVRWSIWL